MVSAPAQRADARAEVLGRRRDEFLSRLPRRIRGAASLAHADQELVVDDAISYIVLQFAEPLEQAADVERVFWAACELRVKRFLDGRHNTVRAGWQRVGDEALLDAAADDDPANVVEEAEERKLVREFAATLAERERRVLRVKYFSGTAEPLGYKKIAETLGITQAAARASDRAIKRGLERFAAVYTAGQLCPQRSQDITALASGTADRAQRRLALAHVAHCQHCQASFAEQLRAIRSAAFERKVAAVLPAVEVQERGRVRGAWDAVVDTALRPFTHEGASTAAQLASSGVGRGAGTIAVLKLAGTCLASAGAIGVCASTFVSPIVDGLPERQTPTTRTAPDPEPVGQHDRPPSRPDQHVVPTPTPQPSKDKPRTGGSSRTQGGTGSRDHERAPVSPAPANAAPGGESEFDPTYTPDGPPTAAPVPAAPGGTEFF
jgi:hypothetical protein